MPRKQPDTPYRGYWIRRGLYSDEWWIEKDEQLVCWCDGLADGRRRVDEIVKGADPWKLK